MHIQSFALFNDLPKATKKTGFVFVISGYYRSIYSPHYDVMQCAGNVQTRLAWHSASVGQLAWVVKNNDTKDTTSPMSPPSFERTKYDQSA